MTSDFLPSRSMVTTTFEPTGCVLITAKGTEAESTGWVTPSGVVRATIVSPSSTLPSASVPLTAPWMVTVAGTVHPSSSRAATPAVDWELCIWAAEASSICSWVTSAG